MTTSTSMRRAACWLAALLALVLAAGCGQSSADRLRAAQQTTLDAGSAAFTIEQSFEGIPGGSQKITTEGVLDFARRLGRATVSMADGKAEVVFAGNATYFRLPLFLQEPKWVRMERQDIEKFANLQGISDDPSRNLDLLDGIVGDIEQVGEEDVRGTPTTHYRFAVDLQKAVENAPADHRETMRQQAAALGGGQLPTEVWLDAEGRIARQTFALDLSKVQLPTGAPLPKDAQVTARTMIEYYDFGTTVDVKPPPDDQVTDLEKLQSG